MSDTKIKICGITRAEDAMLASDYGADAIGMVFYGASPRAVDTATARQLVRAVGPFLSTVALFVNPQASLVREVERTVKPHLFQFHGDESPAFCEQFDRPYLKAIRVNDETDIDALIDSHANAAGFVCDAWSAEAYGGTGETFDWDRLLEYSAANLVLAGGLTPDNVALAIDRVHPYAVDVSSGVESSPGVKDASRILHFIQAVRGRNSVPG